MKIRIFLFALMAAAFFVGLFIRNREDPPRCLADHPTFLQFCARVAHQPEVFEKFKRDPIYSVFNESFSYEEGRTILQILEAESPDILEEELVERIRVVDRYGSPFVHSYDSYGPFSPETLFHLKVAADLKQAFGKQGPLRIVEVGGGCGSLCKVLHEVLDITEYTMVQLEEEQELAQTHLRLIGLDGVKWVNPKELKSLECDLLISAYAFTESSAKQQFDYMKKLFPEAQRGYLICNFLPKHYGIGALKKEKLLKKLGEIHANLTILPEEPRTGLNNCRIIWSQGEGAL